MTSTRSYNETLKELLAEPELAGEYLAAALEDPDLSVFLLVLKDVINYM